jgi:hypothetical protein
LEELYYYKATLKTRFASGSAKISLDNTHEDRDVVGDILDLVDREQDQARELLDSSSREMDLTFSPS